MCHSEVNRGSSRPRFPAWPLKAPLSPAQAAAVCGLLGILTRGPPAGHRLQLELACGRAALRRPWCWHARWLAPTRPGAPGGAASEEDAPEGQAGRAPGPCSGGSALRQAAHDPSARGPVPPLEVQTATEAQRQREGTHDTPGTHLEHLAQVTRKDCATGAHGTPDEEHGDSKVEFVHQREGKCASLSLVCSCSLCCVQDHEPTPRTLQRALTNPAFCALFFLFSFIEV